VALISIKGKIVLSSALAECFLRKMTREGYIRYTEGSEFFDTSEEEVLINASFWRLII
jgi:hypothetical protein